MKKSIKKEERKMTKSKGQVTIFVILALVIIGAIVTIFVFRDRLFVSEVPAEFLPVYQAYENCIEAETRIALDLAGMQGGRVSVGNAEGESYYSPFSSQLNFLGTPVPYWFYVSENGIAKENIPSKKQIENEIARFIEERVNECDFSAFYRQGFYIDFKAPKAKVIINDNNAEVNVDNTLTASRGEASARRIAHNAKVSSNFGMLYNSAVKLYNKQKNEMTFDKYAVDVLRNYAPVDGVEISCSPQIWKTREVKDKLQDALAANFGALKVKGNYYSLNKKENNYFVIDEDISVPARFIYSKQWPSKIEITPANGEIMMAEPVGGAYGMGVLGFCYIPYHFVYDISIPLMVQLGDGLETFQYPIVVIIDNNAARKVEPENLIDLEGNNEYDVCSFNTGKAEIKLYDENLNYANANVSYQCFDSLCYLGETTNGVLDVNIPVCVNGYLVANGNGYSEKKQLFSSNKESSAEMILEREYEVVIDVLVDGMPMAKDSMAVVHMSNEEYSASSVLPENNKIKLKEGQYEINVFVYGNSSIKIPATTKTQCYDTSKGGLLGMMGMTKEQCVDIEIPEMKVENALRGGGNGNNYFLGSELEKGKITLDAQALPVPTSIEQLQENYDIFEGNSVEVIIG
jgi:hypothetical protein